MYEHYMITQDREIMSKVFIEVVLIHKYTVGC